GLIGLLLTRETEPEVGFGGLIVSPAEQARGGLDSQRGMPHPPLNSIFGGKGNWLLRKIQKILL
ncbi:MAG TPA: hypothetical protein DF383_14070, partial [Deltaproteobacteria bacterium]|nr:hypothetical protein [Deltaproteobacteria bacterium]